jgi:UDP-3-O-acyl N-acetylglucosamine deacetylase
LAKSLQFEGISLFGGYDSKLIIHPAPVDFGVRFAIKKDGQSYEIPALWNNVLATPRTTILGNERAKIATVEHLLSALYGMDIDNALIEVDGEELPILDGSSKFFADAIASSSIIEQDSPAKVLKIIRPLHLKLGKAQVFAAPSEVSSFAFLLTSPDAAFHHQYLNFELGEPDDYHQFISFARTFASYKEIEPLITSGALKAIDLRHGVIIHEGKIANSEGLRSEDEFVRHKILDLIGDLSLIGYKLQGAFTAIHSGHAANVQMARMIGTAAEKVVAL